MLFPTSTLGKFVRDFVITAAGVILLSIANDAGQFGIPETYIPFVAPVALLLYRKLREFVSSGQ